MASIIKSTTTDGIQIIPDSTGAFAIQTNGANTALTIDTSQNVGIGTTTPSSFGILSTSGTAANYATALGSADASNLSINNNSVAGLNNRASLTMSIANIGKSVIAGYYATFNGSNDIGTGIQFGTQTNAAGGVVERMRIDSSGNVLVGTTTNNGPGKIALDFDSGANFGLSIRSTNVSNNGVYSRFYNSSNAQAGQIVQTAATTVSYTTSSDYRLKENVQPMVGALDKVAQLKPVTYTWKSDGSDGQGFIAHELQAVVPECVVGEKDAVNEDGSIDPQGIDTSFLVATLTAAIQEQQAIINDLKARIETLENK